MHLGNGAITPECVALTYGAAAAGLAAAGGCVLRSKTQSESVSKDKLLLAAGLGCMVFAAQAINVPVAPGTSAHLVGGVLLACLLGPGLAAWTMALVLAVQALVLGDGGMASLGANALNMALLPAGLVAATRRFMPLLENTAARSAGVGLAAGLAVLLAAGLIVIETALFRSATELSGWASFAALMLGTYAWIGISEGAMTAALVAALLPIAAPSESRVAWRPALVGIAAMLAIAAIVLPISSSLPDGYEAAAQASGMGWLLGP
jgi:cobalt/nickel transport system permease protein